jgi:hypothetical protein
MVIRRLSAGYAVIALLTASCGFAPHADESSNRSAEEGGDGHTASDGKGVKMRFTLPSDVQRARKVNESEAGLALALHAKKDAGSSTAGASTSHVHPSAPLVCQEASQESIDCGDCGAPTATSAYGDKNAVDTCAIPEPISECEKLPEGNVACSSIGYAGEPTESIAHPGYDSCAGGTIDHDGHGGTYDGGYSSYPAVIDSRIQISCLDEAKPQALVLASSMMARQTSSYFDFDGGWWAAPILRIGLEESGPAGASFGIQEVPFFCQGDAAIEIVSLSPGTKYTITADLFDFDATHLYTGSTESFGVEAGSVKGVQLQMTRVVNPTISVVVDLVFDEQEQQQLPVPTPVEKPAKPAVKDVIKPAKP